MGNAYKYCCEHCSFEQEFNQGHGFLVHSQTLNEYMRQPTVLFHYKTHKVLKKLASKSDNLYLKAGFQVFKCPTCKVLYDKTEVVVLDDENVVHKSEFRCNDCRSRLKLTNIHRLKKAICPKCRKRTFKMDHLNIALWD